MTTATIPVDGLTVGDRILYPHLTRRGITMRPVTITGIVEYPANRVLYFNEDGTPGIVGRTAAPIAAATA